MLYMDSGKKKRWSTAKKEEIVMTDIGATIGLASAMIPGIVIGVVGMSMALSTYPIYKKMLNDRKKKYAPEILKLSEKIMQG